MSWYRVSGWAKDNDRWYTKFMKGLNWAFNPYHEWFDYDSWNENSTMGKIESFLKSATDAVGTAVGQLADPSQITSYVNSITGAHLTGSQVEANEMQMQNQEDIYQRQVAGMQKAGINPALMYQSGAQQAPGVQGSQGTGSMSEIMQALLLEKQSKLLDSQTRNTDADTDKKAAETDYQKLINQYYPQVTSTQIDKILSDIGVNEETIAKMKSEIDLNQLELDLKAIDKVIKQAEANESSAYFKAVREYQEAATDKAKAEKAELVVRAAMEELERNFMQHTNTKMGSSTMVALASALGTLLSNFHIDFDADGVKNTLRESFKKLGVKWDEFVEWVNKEKKAPWVK